MAAHELDSRFERNPCANSLARAFRKPTLEAAVVEVLRYCSQQEQSACAFYEQRRKTIQNRHELRLSSFFGSRTSILNGVKDEGTVGVT
jgi:hypothetical protein